MRSCVSSGKGVGPTLYSLRGFAPGACPGIWNEREPGQATLSGGQPSKDMTVVSRADGELVARCRAGDVDAFEGLYRQHAPRLYSLACRMTGSASDAEDLLQEIFLQAHVKLRGFKGEASVGTWLYRLAINQCLDFLRSRRTKVGRLTDPLDPDGTAEEPVAPRESTAARLDLERAIASLPAGYREAFVLHDVEGFEHKEVATMLGIAEGTSKSQVFKARMRLRALLQGAPYASHRSGGQ
jgi:RNA polymerase sigma-70 factor, ECF subfamily